MKTTWLRKEGAEELLLFFNGWGMDRRLADHILNESLSAGFTPDLLACHDYRNLRPESGVMEDASRYGRISVIAWSFGVWVAKHTELPPIERAIAVNGTLHPVNAEKGIPPGVFDATLSTFSEENSRRFNRRMCGDTEVQAFFSGMLPDREAMDQQEELACLKEHLLNSSSNICQAWQYNHAVIGGRDLVFPAQQQFNAWKGVPQTVITDMPHFPFFHFRTLQEVLECIR